jgi:hypothetical protein
MRDVQFQARSPCRYGAGCDRMARGEPWTHQPQRNPDLHPGCHRPRVVGPGVGVDDFERLLMAQNFRAPLLNVVANTDGPCGLISCFFHRRPSTL